MCSAAQARTADSAPAFPEAPPLSRPVPSVPTRPAPRPLPALSAPPPGRLTVPPLPRPLGRCPAPLLVAPPSTGPGGARPCPYPSPLALSSSSVPLPHLPRLQRLLLPESRPSSGSQQSGPSLQVPPPSRPGGRCPLPCSGDSRARRCTWRRESGCISCSSSRPHGCTPEGRGDKGREVGKP